MLVASVAIALAADRMSASAALRPAASASPEISPFVASLGAAAPTPAYVPGLVVDPFERERAVVQAGVASGQATPTVPAVSRAPHPARRLTAILIADERRVAVIDERTVGIGDVLRDGSRVSRIQPDRVWVVERNGRWQMLTLTTGGQ